MKTTFLFILAFCLSFTSCTKKTTPSTGIAGTYIGDEGLANPPIISSGDTVTISQGSGTNTIIITDAFAGVKLNATISNDSIVIPNQTAAFGNTTEIDTFYGTGVARNDSLYYVLYENGNGTTLSSSIINFYGGKR